MQDKRNEIQNEAVFKWISKHKRGTVEIATGLGKTFIALHALHTMPKNDDKLHLFLAEVKDRKGDILVNIKKYDKIFGTKTLDDYNLQFHCYQTVRAWKDTPKLGLIIADEIHDSLTPENSKFYEYNTYDAIIGLSAKVDQSVEYIEQRGALSYTITKGTYLRRHCPIIFTYSMQEARKNKVNRALNIHIISNELDDVELNIKAGSKKKSFFQTEKEAYRYWDKKFEDSKKIKDPIKRNLFQKIAISKRSNLLYSLPSKIAACRKLLKNLDRVVLFGNSIDALLKVTPFVVSSRNSDAQNNYYRTRFEKGENDNIASFKKLKQGANMSNLLNMVLMSYYSKEGDAIQRLGRLRIEGDLEGNVYILVTSGTKEVAWYMSMIGEVLTNYNVVRHADIDQCIKYINYKKTNENKN